MTVLATITNLPDGRWAVSSTYDEAAAQQFKAMPGCRFDWDRRAWAGPPEAIQLVVETLEAAKVLIPHYALSSPRPYTCPLYNANDLYDYQKEGVEFLLSTAARAGGALLGDGMGVGKTVQALRALDAIARFPLIRLREEQTTMRESFAGGWKGLVLCPAIAALNWQLEAEKWLGIQTVRLDGPKTKKNKAAIQKWQEEGGLAISSYDSFRNRGAVPVDLLVLDEIHYLANPKSARSKAVAAFLESHRPHVFGLSGTPMTSRLRDLWHPLNLLFPGRFGSKSQFERRYAGGRDFEIPGKDKHAWIADGATNVEELAKRLKNGGLMLRRVADDILELPSLRRIVVPVELPDKAKKALSMAMSAVSYTESKSVQRILSNIEEYKTRAAIELAENLLDEGKKVILYTVRKDTAEEIGFALNAPVVTGETPADKRREKLIASQVAVATVYSVTTAINLVEFDVAIFVGLDWVPSVLAQAEKRLHRIGQDSKVTFYYLIAMNTLDEVVRSRVIERLDTFSAVVGGSEAEEKMAMNMRGAEDEESLLNALLDEFLGKEN